MTDATAPEHRAQQAAAHIDEAAGYDTVLVLDFGAQYGQLIARRVRECHVYSQLIPFDSPLDQIRARKPRGLILSGGNIPQRFVRAVAERLRSGMFAAAPGDGSGLGDFNFLRPESAALVRAVAKRLAF